MEVLVLNEMITLMQYFQSAADMGMQWFTDGKISLSDQKEIVLQKEQKYNLLKIIFASPSILTLQEKTDLLAKEKVRDFSDSDLLHEQGCLSANYEDAAKLAVWESYVKGSFNVKFLEASSRHFYNYLNVAQCQDFADHFFDSIESVFATHHRDYAQAFFLQLSPTFLGRE